MALATTLAAMRTEFFERGGYRRSTSITPEIATKFLNNGIVELHKLIVKHNADYIVKRTNPDLVATPNVDTIPLPADFEKLRAHPLRIQGPEKLKITPFDLDEESEVDDDAAFGWGGPGYRYMLQAGNLRLLPAPTSADTIRLWYLPSPTLLVNDADPFDKTGGADQLVIEWALKQAAERDRRSSTDFVNQIALLEARFKWAIESRDQAEPEYLPDLGRGIPLWKWGVL